MFFSILKIFKLNGVLIVINYYLKLSVLSSHNMSFKFEFYTRFYQANDRVTVII